MKNKNFIASMRTVLYKVLMHTSVVRKKAGSNHFVPFKSKSLNIDAVQSYYIMNLMKHWKLTLLTLTLIITPAFSSIAQPPVPALSAATNVDCSSFMANWSASAGATGYYLEVSTVTTFAT